MRLQRAVFLASLALSASLVAGAKASSIGLNFVGGDNNVADTLTSGLSAGVVPQANWNNLYSGSQTGSSTSTIFDSTSAGTPVTASWSSSAGLYDNSSTSNTSPLSTNGDQILNNGGIWGSPSVTVSGVPYSQYNVIVTTLVDHAATIIGTTLTGGPTYYADQTQAPNDPGYIDGTSSTFTYTQSTDTSGAGTPLGDYALFTGVTGSSFTVGEPTISGGASNAVLSSIEIVSTPEPASLAVLALGGLGLLARRRRA